MYEHKRAAKRRRNLGLDLSRPLAQQHEWSDDEHATKRACHLLILHYHHLLSC